MERLWSKQVDLGKFGTVSGTIHAVGDSESIRLVKSYSIRGKDRFGVFKVLYRVETQTAKSFLSSHKPT